MNDCAQVLVVEDDAVIGEIIVSTLLDEGVIVRHVRDGRAGLDELANCTPFVIVLDLMMPGMDGWQFRAEQRRRGLAPDAELILISARLQLADAQRALGAVAYLTKPFRLDELVTLVENGITRGLSRPSQM